jgi:hypothetical protein
MGGDGIPGQRMLLCYVHKLMRMIMDQARIDYPCLRVLYFHAELREPPSRAHLQPSDHAVVTPARERTARRSVFCAFESECAKLAKAQDVLVQLRCTRLLMIVFFKA